MARRAKLGKIQGRVADLTKGGLQKILNFYAIKILPFLKFYVKRLKKAYHFKNFCELKRSTFNNFTQSD